MTSHTRTRCNCAAVNCCRWLALAQKPLDPVALLLADANPSAFVGFVVAATVHPAVPTYSDLISLPRARNDRTVP